MIRARRALFAAVLGALMAASPAAPVRADQAAKDFLDAVYKTYVGKDAKGVPIDSARFAKLLTPGLMNLIAADAKRAARRREVPNLDGDPFVDAQDWEIASYTIDVQDTAPGKATALVKFRNQDEDKTLTLYLLQINGAWRIDDITGADGSLRKLLARR